MYYNSLDHPVCLSISLDKVIVGIQELGPAGEQVEIDILWLGHTMRSRFWKFHFTRRVKSTSFSIHARGLAHYFPEIPTLMRPQGWRHSAAATGEDTARPPPLTQTYTSHRESSNVLGQYICL